MKKFPITKLARAIKAYGRQATGDKQRFFTGVSIDSRTIRAGDCFFAIAGENFDGHNYIADAFAKGASCAVVGKDVPADKFPNGVILKVSDTIKALGEFAKQYRRQNGFRVIAITGSVGKTTTRKIISYVLSRHFRCCEAPKNFNNNIGLPLTLLAADPQDQIVVVELGSSFPGEIAYLTRIAAPDMAVVTNVHPAHLAGFGGLETVIREKLSISEGLQKGGAFIINGDLDYLVDACRAKGIAFTTFGRSNYCDIRAKDIVCTNGGSRFTVDGAEIFLPLLGPGNIENALAAWSVCSRLGISIDDFACAVKMLPAVPMRAELLKAGTVTVLNDCYNANPASMKNALDILAVLGLGQDRRLVFICGDMAEMGKRSKQLHTELGASVAQAKVQLLLTVGRFAKIAARSAKKNADYNLQTKSFEDTLSACNSLAEFIKDYDIILVKGSRAAGLEIVIDKLKELFS